MDRDTLPRWGWLLGGLFVAAILANLVNVLVLGPAGLPEEYYVLSVITAMAPVLIYVGVWYDEERRGYWEHSRGRIVADAVFVVLGAAVGSSIALVLVLGSGLPWILEELVAMGAGFALGWGLFWWRNPEIYRPESTR